LSLTRLPLAIQFLATELKHTGLLSSGFARLPHYFAPFQAFVIRQSEEEKRRFALETALLILGAGKRNIARASRRRPASSFTSFEVLSRNRLGYDQGLQAMQADPFYAEAWQKYVEMVRRHVGVVDFADLVYLRSQFYVLEQQPAGPPTMSRRWSHCSARRRARSPKRIAAGTLCICLPPCSAKLGYPEVPKPQPRDDPGEQSRKPSPPSRELEMRASCSRRSNEGQVDLSPFLNKTGAPLRPAGR